MSQETQFSVSSWGKPRVQDTVTQLLDSHRRLAERKPNDFIHQVRHWVTGAWLCKNTWHQFWPLQNSCEFIQLLVNLTRLQDIPPKIRSELGAVYGSDMKRLTVGFDLQAMRVPSQVTRELDGRGIQLRMLNSKYQYAAIWCLFLTELCRPTSESFEFVEQKDLRGPMIKINQSYSTYINIHTVGFLAVWKNKGRKKHCAFHCKLKSTKWRSKHCHLSKDQLHWNQWNYFWFYFYCSSPIDLKLTQRKNWPYI